MKIKDSKFYLLGGIFTILILIVAIVPSLIISNNANANNKNMTSNHRMDKPPVMSKKDLMMKKYHRMDKPPSMGKKDLMMKKNHKIYKPPSMGKKDLMMKNESYNGIGVKIKLNSDNETMISFVYKNGPAHNSGIRSGDIILEINGESLKNKTLFEVTNIIKNDNSDEIDLLIQHTLSETPITLKVTKALINTR
jgi:membrane-associated protease RseP (regulator of RpoE activity)